MRFDVVKRASYTLDNASVRDFKEAMLEYLEKEMLESEELKEGQNLPYTIDNISDTIVYEALAETVQYAFEDEDFYHSGIQFDGYFDSMSLDFDTDEIRDCVYGAVVNWRTEMDEQIC